MKTTLDILSAASGYKYSSTDIVKKIDFVMTDSTAHNLKVIEKVKISYEDCFSFHWFYLQAIFFINISLIFYYNVFEYVSWPIWVDLNFERGLLEKRG